MTSNELMKANIRKLLELRQRQPEDLARWCHNSKSWIDKIFGEPRRTFTIEYYERIAKFFGVEVYQLLQPGIADRSERRVSVGDRRKWRDRRVSQAVLSEKPLDVDLIHVVRALSPQGRQTAIAVLMDILNDELRRPPTKAGAPSALNRTAETPSLASVQPVKEKRKPPK